MPNTADAPLLGRESAPTLPTGIRLVTAAGSLPAVEVSLPAATRSEERRVGKECPV